MATPSITFADGIRPLFRDYDRDAMAAWLDLWIWEDVRDAADLILARVEDGSMPCDGSWPEESVALFRQWVEDGCPR